jgi:hypothetical protein
MDKFEKLKLALNRLEAAQSTYKSILSETFNVGDSISWRSRGYYQAGKVTSPAFYTPEFGTKIKVKNINTGVEYFIQLYQVFEAEN